MEVALKVFTGIDVSKGYADFCIVSESGEDVVEPFQLDDTERGYSAMWEVFNELVEKGHDEIVCAVESTAGYENNWLHVLVQMSDRLPLKVARLNPFPVKKFSEAVMGRNKTDKTSSYHIANYLRKCPEQIRYEEDNPYSAMRKYWSYISLQMKVLRQLSNNLQSIVYSANPELLSQCKFGFSGRILNVLKEYPTAKKLARAKVKKLSMINGINDVDASDMIAAAKTSVASLQDDLIGEMISSSARQIEQISSSIDRAIDTILKERRPKEIDLLMSIPGIGERTALILFMEIGCIHRFRSSRELASYAGIHPMVRESGDGSKRPKMSKRGRKMLRTALFLPAMVAARRDEYIGSIYDKQIEKGKSKMSAYGIIMHKLLRIAYGVLKTGKTYNSEIDKINRTDMKPPENKDETSQTPLRRFQSYEEKAPISKHAAKKRKQSVSHSVSAKICAGSKTAGNENMEILQTVNTEVKNETISS